MGDDREHAVLAFAVAHPMRDVDATRDGVDKRRDVTLHVQVDLVSDAEQPADVADAEVHREREIHEAEHARPRVGRASADLLARQDEHRERAISGIEARAERLVSDGDTLALGAEIMEDAEQVARVDTGGHGPGAALGGACDGGAQMQFGIPQ